MYFARRTVLFATAFFLLAGAVAAQNNNKKVDPEAGYIPTVAPADKSKKKKGEEITQALALPPELPAAVTAETERLAFQVTPLSAKGLLSQQTHEALKGLLHSSRGPIVKLRAFVAGSGDLRRIGEITGEMFQEKHMALPALTVVQVGALPLEGAQVLIEATEVERKIVNPSGVAFLAAQPAQTVAESLEKLKSILATNGMEPAEALLVTCFVSSFDAQRDTQQSMAAAFPGAALSYLQMQRQPVTPPVACEATARQAKPASSVDAAIALVASPEVIITGTQLSFGGQDNDLKLAFDRLGRALASRNARLDHAVVSHFYVTSAVLISRVVALDPQSKTRTALPIEALPSLDSSFGVEVIAVPDSRPAHP